MWCPDVRGGFLVEIAHRDPELVMVCITTQPEAHGPRSYLPGVESVSLSRQSKVPTKLSPVLIPTTFLTNISKKDHPLMAVVVPKLV